MLRTVCWTKSRTLLLVLLLFLTMFVGLCGCSSKGDLPATRAVFVLPPAEYMKHTPEPKIDDYSNDGAGLSQYAKDTRAALNSANDDKKSMRDYVAGTQAQETK